MKSSLPLLLTLLSAYAYSASAAESRPAPTAPAATEASWGVRDLPRLVTPRGFVAIARQEIRDGIDDAKEDFRGVRAGDPKAMANLAFTGASLAGVDGGAVLGARLVYARLTMDPHAAQPLLSEELPHKLEQAPDRTFRRGVKAVVRHGFTGDVGDAIAGDLTGQAIELAPAALRSARHILTRAFADRAPAAAAADQQS